MGVKETVEHRADTLRAIAYELERAEFVGMFAGSASQKWMSAQLREIAGPPPDRAHTGTPDAGYHRPGMAYPDDDGEAE